LRYLRLENELNYDGSQIEPQWAFKAYKIKDSSIISWIGPMNIHQDNIVDFEDQGKEIKGNELLHFIVEHFDVQPADIRLCYHRQRLLVLITQNNLDNLNIKTIRRGDDLYVSKEDGMEEKLTVSIATANLNSMKIHFAINITSEGTPSDIDITALKECNKGLNNEDIVKLADTISNKYIDELENIEADITKTKVL
jgi:uncharacterized protein